MTLFWGSFGGFNRKRGCAPVEFGTLHGTDRTNAVVSIRMAHFSEMNAASGPL
ncbi:MAG: hypothetical protein WCR46_25110 [Deltaproteobacteria bacterium]